MYRKFVIFITVLFTSAALMAQLPSRRKIQMEAPPILYSSGALHDPVAELNRKISDGSARLAFDDVYGYLPALLNALGIGKESQLLVFSKTSLQSILISPTNPRAIYFNDASTVAWVRGGPVLEVVTQDPQQGAIFYTLDQSVQTKPVLARESLCLACHQTESSLDIPGMVVRSVFPGATGLQVTGLIGSEVDHRSPFDERWGGWYVTGKHGPLRHVGNAVVRDVHEATAAANPADARPSPAPAREPLPERFSITTYPTPYSDVVSLAVFEHQMHMMNLLTRIGWDSRVGPRPDAVEFVDYLLFVDEAPWSARVEGTSGFAEKFASLGPFDSKGRSLRQFDLENRLMRYPCSYMIYSDAFKALNADAKNAIFERMWEVLSGQAKEKKYTRLSSDDRKAVIEILHDTIPDLPTFFKTY